MTNPFKRFFGGIMIGIFLSIPFLQGQGEPLGSKFMAKIQTMSLIGPDSFLAASVAFLGLTCAWVGAMATRRVRLSFASRSSVETVRRRRQSQRGHHLLR